MIMWKLYVDTNEVHHHSMQLFISQMAGADEDRHGH